MFAQADSFGVEKLAYDSTASLAIIYVLLGGVLGNFSLNCRVLCPQQLTQLKIPPFCNAHSDDDDST